MRQVLSLHQTTLGKKILMAGTGLLLMGFVVVHMLGNLKAFQEPVDGHYKLDLYGEFLRNFGYPALGHEQFLWVARIALLAAVGIHIWAAGSLSVHNRRARPVKYRKWQAEESNYASRTMIWGGIIIALFVVYHILHFTTGQAHPGFVPGAVHANMVAGFSIWWVSAVYIVAQIALGLHLYHGFWSAFRTLGANNPRFEKARRGAALLIAAVVALGNISIPVAVMAGIVK